MDWLNSTTPLIAKLPLHKQSGWFVTKPEDVSIYCACFFGSIVFFAILTLVLHNYFERTDKDHYYH